MRGVISVPNKIIIGAFDVRFSFFKPVDDFDMSNVNVDTLSGDPILDYHTFNKIGNGQGYYLTYKMPESCVGKSRISFNGEVNVNGIQEEIKGNYKDIEYDTDKDAAAVFGDQFYRNRAFIVPFDFPFNIIGLTKRHFNLIKVSGNVLSRLKFSLYGSENKFYLSFYPKYGGSFIIQSNQRSLVKENGIIISMIESSIEVQCNSVGE